jgi:hypothetical protein
MWLEGLNMLTTGDLAKRNCQIGGWCSLFDLKRDIHSPRILLHFLQKSAGNNKQRNFQKKIELVPMSVINHTL